MKLGISYNIFDGEELLKASISCIREQVDYISAVYQINSWFGPSASPDLLDLLYDLIREKYIDEVYKYNSPIDNTFNERTAHKQQVEKRNIGLKISLENGCTHHMPMDIDEFYLSDQFCYMKSIVEEGGFNASACKHRQYYKDSIYMITPSEQEYVGLIYRINNFSRFVYNYPCIIPIDPSRKMNNDDYRLFDRSEIEMHHMSYVRKDIRKKLEASIARKDIAHNIDKIVNHYENWEYPQPAMWAGGNLLQVVKVNKQFDINI